jgi:hypothetical protein
MKIKQLATDTPVPNSSTPVVSYFGAKQANTDDSLKAGSIGPTLLEDSHFRERGKVIAFASASWYSPSVIFRVRSVDFPFRSRADS